MCFVWNNRPCWHPMSEYGVEGDGTGVDDGVALHCATVVLYGNLQELGDGNLSGQCPKQVLPQVQAFQHIVGYGGVLTDIPLHIYIFRSQGNRSASRHPIFKRKFRVEMLDPFAPLMVDLVSIEPFDCRSITILKLQSDFLLGRPSFYKILPGGETVGAVARVRVLKGGLQVKRFHGCTFQCQFLQIDGVGLKSVIQTLGVAVLLHDQVECKRGTAVVERERVGKVQPFGHEVGIVVVSREWSEHFGLVLQGAVEGQYIGET